MMNVKDFDNAGKYLTFVSTTNAPAIRVPQDRIRAAHFGKLFVRIKTTVFKDDIVADEEKLALLHSRQQRRRRSGTVSNQPARLPEPAESHKVADQNDGKTKNTVV